MLGDRPLTQHYNIPEDAEVADPPSPARLPVSPVLVPNRLRTSSGGSNAAPNAMVGFTSINHPTSTADDSKFDFYSSQGKLTHRRTSSASSIVSEEDFLHMKRDSNTAKRDSSPALKKDNSSLEMKYSNVAPQSVAADDTAFEHTGQKKLKFWNSTSTLYVKSTMSKPDVTRSVRCISSLIHEKVKSSLKKNVVTSEFDEPEEYYAIRMPSDKHALYRYILNIYTDAQLTIECLVMSLVYLDRLMNILDLTLTTRNLRPVVLCSLMLASKVWDDVSMWNVDFCEIYPRFPLYLLNHWERKFLNILGFNVSVSATEYARYYFNLREEEIKLNGGLESDCLIKPLTPQEAGKLEMLSRGSSLANVRRGRAMTQDSSDVQESKERHVLS